MTPPRSPRETRASASGRGSAGNSRCWYWVSLRTSIKTMVPGIPAYKHQDNDFRLLAQGSSGAVTCSRGSCLLARGSSGATTCHLPSSTHHLAHGSSGAVTCPNDGFCRPQVNKQISPDDQATMISIGARTHVSSKTLRDKGCSVHSQGVQQAAH
jgi:hypothetical protein